MAVRNSAVRRIPGNPLGGVLRHTARMARSTTRRLPSLPGPEGPQGAEGPPGPAATAVSQALTCDETGTATWDLPSVDGPVWFGVTPVSDVPLIAALVSQDSTRAVFRAWHCDGTPWPGATLHVVLVAAPAPPEPAPVDLPEQPTTEGP